MNKLLIKTGIMCTAIWAFVTWMTFGLPVGFCAFLNKITFKLFSDPIFDMMSGFAYDVYNNDMPTVMFLVLFTIAFALVFYVILRLSKMPTKKSSLGIIVGFAILFRIILLPGELIHENDIYRYLWDGKVFKYGTNPYKYAPDDIKGERLIQLKQYNPTYFYRIGHREVPTIYPPVMQSFFAAASLIKEDSILFFKLLFVLFDIGVIFVMIALLRHFKKDPCWCLVYAWSPLVLKEIANAGHYDAVPVFLMMLGLFLFVKRKEGAGMLALTLAALSKFFAVLLLPLLKRLHAKKYIGIFIFITVLFYLPFFIKDGVGIGVSEGLVTYGEFWAYNASIFALIQAVFMHVLPTVAESYVPAKVVTGVLFLGVLVYQARQRVADDFFILHQCFVVMAVLFLFNPVGDPWYFCWVMPFLCLFPYRAWILLSGLLMFSYLDFHSDFPYLSQEIFYIPLLNWLIYVPFFVVLAMERAKRRKHIAYSS